MASYEQPYNELGSAIVRALALNLEGQGFDSSGIERAVMKFQLISTI